MNIFEKLESVARGVESTLKDELGTQQIKTEISKEKGKINRLKEEIGDCCWKRYSGVSVQEEEIRGRCEEIKACTEKIKELETKLSASAEAQPSPEQSMVKCPSCGQDNKKQAKFCGHCGAKLVQEESVRACPMCGAKNGGETTFCAECGSKL